ncbi:hypothetical protein [Actinoplanes sp. NPDC026619]|uniref:hypothetical protein n=1 Tax=Actinoplanes sp. NPDC026619 TaxID=3155798 RepID=UPI0033D5BFA8
MSAWGRVAALAEQVPSGVWMVLVAANLVATLMTWSTTRRRIRRAGQRAADPQLVAGGVTRPRDTVLTVAALIPAGLFWAMVLAGSFHGLIAFGREVLGWRGGWEYLVPGTLDGVSVTFAFLAFRAVPLSKAPDRCYRVVWGAAIASATVNFAYEYTHSDHNVVAGGYVALLSLFGMLMLHEFLAQFEEGAAHVKRSNPKFGARWLTWPTNTFCAAVAWRNYPPADGTPATVLNAIANLDRVRALKRAVRDTEIVSRHQEALAAEQRQQELQAATERPETAAAATSGAGEVIVTVSAPGPWSGAPAGPVEAPTLPRAVAPLSVEPTPRAPSKPGKADGDEPQGTGVRVPATAATIRDWVALWLRMCADGRSALGPLNDDDARGRYGLTAKQLRNVRHAATSGALRQQAITLGVELPPGYVDSPPAAPIIAT